jgi:hypothetical protein
MENRVIGQKEFEKLLIKLCEPLCFSLCGKNPQSMKTCVIGFEVRNKIWETYKQKKDHHF